MRNIVVLLGALSLTGCGGSDMEQPVVVQSPSAAVIQKDTSSVFFHVGMYQNGTSDTKYTEKNSNYDINLTIFNKSNQSKNEIFHKLNYTDVNGNIYSENYVIDVQKKLLIKVNESILHKDQTYKTFNYNGQYIQFDFNLEKGQERIQRVNVNTYDSALHESLIIPTKVTTKYLGLDNILVNNSRYNVGKFETIEEIKNFKAIITTWFNITNGVVLKQSKNIQNIQNNTIEESTINIVNSPININTINDIVIFAKFYRTINSENNEFITSVVYGKDSNNDSSDTFIFR